MKLLVLGASGKTGKLVVEQALAAGHSVTALVRDGGKWQSKQGLTIAVGDACRAQDIENVVGGQDAVIAVLGSAHGKDRVIERSMQTLAAAAPAAGLRRIILLSTYLCTPNYQPTFAGRLGSVMIKRMLKDKKAGEAILRRSDLDWTIVYATPLDNAPPGHQVRSVAPEEKVGKHNGIARADVARFLLNQLNYPAAYRQSVLITTQ